MRFFRFRWPRIRLDGCYPILGPVFNPPILDGTTVYIGATDGMVYALHADNGKAIWHYLIQVGG